MKTIIKCILLCFFCVAVTACSSENLDTYRDKLLDSVASELKTTKELLIQDLDVRVDSMSLTYFLVEDSIYIIENKYKEELRNKEKQIESYKESIKKLENLVKKESGVFTSLTAEMSKSSIKTNKRYIKEIESEISKLTENYKSELSKYESRDSKEKIYNVFCYRVSLKNPMTQMHNSSREMSLFSLDGETYIKDVDNEIQKYLEQKQ